MNDQLMQKIQQARDAGVPEEMIRQRVQQQFGVDISATKVTGSDQPGFLSNVVSSLASPFVKSGKAIGGGLFASGQAIKAKLAKTPEEQRQIWGMENPFYSREELSQVSTSPGRFLFEKGIKPAAGVASWAIPVGKGATFASKFVTPGAAIGGLQALSTTKKEKAEDILTDIGAGAIKGAAFSAAIGVLTTALGKLGGRLEKAGGETRQGVRQIYEPGSIYGAGKEKAVNEALDKLGVKGNPQSQYEQLLPVYKKLSGNIDDALAAKPNVMFDTMQLKKKMMESIGLSDEIRMGVITRNEAQKALNDYMAQIMSSKSAVLSFGNRISGRDLFNIKMNVMNPDVSKAYDAINRGQSLTTVQRIVKGIRDATDDILAEVYPDAKQATVLQSRLYDAADSLNKARKTVPTFRVLGITLPQPIKASLQDLIGSNLQVAGRAASAGQLPGVAPSIAGVGARIVGSDLSSQQPNQYPQYEGAQPNQQINYNQGGGQLNQTSPILSQFPSNVPPTPQAVNDTRSKVALLMLQYPKYATQIKAAYEMMQPGGTKELSVEGQKVKGLVTTGIRNAKQAYAMYQKDQNLLTKQLVPGRFASRAFDKAMYDAVDTLLRLRTGAQANPSEIRGYMERLGPTFGDSPEVVQYKIQSLIQDLSDYTPTPTTPGVFPEYPSQYQFPQ